jgi:hypothetical protein
MRREWETKCIGLKSSTPDLDGLFDKVGITSAKHRILELGTIPQFKLGVAMVLRQEQATNMFNHAYMMW